MATEADLIQKFKDLNIPVGADFEELIHVAFAGANLADLVNNYDSRITTVENDLSTAKNSIQANTDNKVTDNHDGTEQLNGVQVRPFNKLSDTIGGRNLLIGTSDFTGWTLSGNTAQGTTDGLTYAHLFVDRSAVAPNFTLAESTTYTVSFDALGQSAGTTQIYIGYSEDSNGNIIASDYANATLNALDGASVRVSLTFTTPSSFTKTNFNIGCGRTYNIGGSVYIRHVKLEKGSIATDWSPAPEDKADDSKVAHLSGANNFDTVPTVNNNPLLLASSLPSDIARTGQDTNFTGKLQKSGIDVATKSDVTTAINTATANMVDPSKPTNFTAGLKSGGIDVATAADLKSIEDSAWRQLADKYITLSSGTLNTNNFLYKIDSDKKYLYVLGGIVVNGRAVTVTIDFSWLVKNIKIDTNHYLQYYGNAPLNLYNVYDVTEKNKLEFTTENGSSVNISTFSISGSSYAIFDELV